MCVRAPGRPARRPALRVPAGRGARGLWVGLLVGLAATAVLLLRRYGRALTARTTTAPAAVPAT
ncbi:hypothetical protein OH807_05695 [Kitasatospora sp. NBC_01560]|uniref:hypothetical protein n=1 Tax=Kitasatospora sp. NBC_01560 TaxID=2975965 RepID=UPI00386B2D7F